MSKLIDYAIGHARLTIATLLFLLCAGMVAYVTIPKEAEPDIKIPIIYVQLSQRGISPEDSERLLLRPVETQLKSVGNVKEMRSTAFEGGGFVLLEFEAGFDSKSALADVRAKVDDAKRELGEIKAFLYTRDSPLQVSNVDEAAQRAVQLGGKIVRPPFDTPGNERMVEIEDTEGNRFGLVAPRK